MKDSMLTLSSEAQWHSLVHEAQAKTHLHLSEMLEHYLVVLLIRFTRRAQSLSDAVAPHYLEAMSSECSQRPAELRDVGDTCLLLSGLFPGRTSKLAVNTDYYIGLGRSAYGEAAAHLDTDEHPLFTTLARRFISAMDVLMAIRLMNSNHAMLPDALSAFELNQQHGSNSAGQVLSKHCRTPDGVILNTPSQRHLH